MGTYYVQIGGGLVLAALGFGFATESPVGWVFVAVGSVLTQIGVIAAAVHQATERLHRAIGEVDDAVSALDPSTK